MKILSESVIRSWLELDDYLRVAKAIQTAPKKPAEIIRLANLGTEARCAEILGKLEDLHAIEYTTAGWKITDMGQRVLEKYFS